MLDFNFIVDQILETTPMGEQAIQTTADNPTNWIGNDAVHFLKEANSNILCGGNLEKKDVQVPIALYPTGSKFIPHSSSPLTALGTTGSNALGGVPSLEYFSLQSNIYIIYIYIYIELPSYNFLPPEEYRPFIPLATNPSFDLAFPGGSHMPRYN